jgi:hypothetical protein
MICPSEELQHHRNHPSAASIIVYGYKYPYTMIDAMKILTRKILIGK